MIFNIFFCEECKGILDIGNVYVIDLSYYDDKQKITQNRWEKKLYQAQKWIYVKEKKKNRRENVDNNDCALLVQLDFRRFKYTSLSIT